MSQMRQGVRVVMKIEPIKNNSKITPIKKEKKTGENKYQWIPLFMVIFGFGFGGIINYLFGISYPDY